MDKTIKTDLIPVRHHVEYVSDNCVTPHLKRVCAVACRNGELLTGAIPFSWMQYLCRAINQQSYYIKDDAFEAEELAVIEIPYAPMEKTDSQTIAQTNDGMKIISNPSYLNHMKKIALRMESLFLFRCVDLPIEGRINIACSYRVTSTKTYNLPLLNAWILDLLDKLCIIKSKNSRCVVSMDGSRIIHDQEGDRTIVTISRVKG